MVNYLISIYSIGAVGFFELLNYFNLGERGGGLHPIVTGIKTNRGSHPRINNKLLDSLLSDKFFCYL